MRRITQKVRTPGFLWSILSNSRPLFPYLQLDRILNPWGFGSFQTTVRLDESSTIEFVVRGVPIQPEDREDATPAVSRLAEGLSAAIGTTGRTAMWFGAAAEARTELVPVASGRAYRVESPPQNEMVTRELAEELRRVLERFAAESGFNEARPVGLYFKPGVVGHHQVGRAADIYGVAGLGSTAGISDGKWRRKVRSAWLNRKSGRRSSKRSAKKTWGGDYTRRCSNTGGGPSPMAIRSSFSGRGHEAKVRGDLLARAY